MIGGLAEPGKPLDPWRILIIEDSPEDADDIRRMLLRGSERRYLFSTVEKGAEGVRAVLEAPPDCLILDYTLPDMTAEEVLAALRAQGGFPPCPVVVLTGRVGCDLGRIMLEAGAQDYVGKDWSGPQSLTRAIENSVDRWEMLVRLRGQERDARLNWLRLSHTMEAAAAAAFEWDERFETVTRPLSSVPGLPANPDTPESRATFLDRIHPEDRQKFEQTLLESRQSGAAYVNSFRITQSDGDVRHLEDRGHIIDDSAGGSSRLTGISVDVTERIRLQDQLRQSQKMEAIGHLAGGVAHDFNNLLTVINGYSDFIIPMLPAEGMLHDSIEAIFEAGEQAAALTRQLLAFGGRSIVAPAIIDLNQATRDAVRMLRRLIGGVIRLDLNFADHPGKVRIDPNLYQQILINLAVNARQAMPDGGRLTITIANRRIETPRRPDRAAGEMCACVTVSDGGPGMTPQVRDRIFEPFFTTKEVGQGSGLGLSVVHGIVHQFEGDISVDSVPGRGTTFDIRFPLIDQSEKSPESKPQVPTTPDGGSETVLVVEDEPGVRSLLRAALRSKGYAVLVAATPLEGLAIASAHAERIDLLIADVVQSDLSVRELSERIRLKCPGLKTLYISGHNEDIVSRNGVNLNRDPFLHKPFSLPELTRKIRELLHPTSVNTRSE